MPRRYKHKKDSHWNKHWAHYYEMKKQEDPPIDYSAEDSMMGEWDVLCTCISYYDDNGNSIDRICENCNWARPPDQKSQLDIIRFFMQQAEGQQTVESRLPRFKSLFIYLMSCDTLLEKFPKLKQAILNKITEFSADPRASSLVPVMKQLETVLKGDSGEAGTEAVAPDAHSS